MGTAVSPRVAIIDDDESLCRSLARLLRLAGYCATAFHSAEQFLAEGARESFACLLVDVQLGGMSGLEMQRQLTAESCHVPVIFITAHDEPLTRDEAAKGGCAGFFRKTESGARILDAIDRVTARTAKP
jgi:FixJ family two-component response regulator